MIKIRRAENKDIPEINNLLYQVEKVHYELRPDIFKPDVKKYSSAELESIINSYDTPVFVAVNNRNNVIGYAFCIFLQSAGRILRKFKSLYIDDFCVDMTERGKHIGSALYEHVLGFARANGCERVTLNVWADNKNALAFYKKMGLTPQKITMEKIIK